MLGSMMLRSSVPMSPWGGRGSMLEGFAQEFDRLFSALGRAIEPIQGGSTAAVNIWREDEALVVESELPGFSLEDVEVLASEDTLTIRAHHQDQDQWTPEGARPITLERRTRSFDRTISLPVPIDPDAVSASLVNGVLTVRLPLAASARPRRGAGQRPAGARAGRRPPAGGPDGRLDGGVRPGLGDDLRQAKAGAHDRSHAASANRR